MIIFGISFLDQTGNFLLSSYFFYRWGRGEGQRGFSCFFGGGGREGGESIVHSGPVKNIITMFSCQWVHFFFSISGAIDGNHIPFSLYSIFEMTTPLPSKLK